MTAWLEVPVPDGDLEQARDTVRVLRSTARQTAAGADDLRRTVARTAAGAWEGDAADAFSARTTHACSALTALADDQWSAADRVDEYVQAWAAAEAAAVRAQADLDDALGAYLQAAPAALGRVAAHLSGFLRGALSAVDAVLPFGDDVLAAVGRALDRLGSWSPPSERPRPVAVRTPDALPRVSADGVLRGLEAGGPWGVSHLLDAVRAVAHWVGGAVDGAMAGVHAVERALAAAVEAAQRLVREALERLRETAVRAATALGQLADDVGRRVVRAVAEVVQVGADLVAAVVQVGLGLGSLLGVVLAAGTNRVLDRTTPRRMADAAEADRQAAVRWRDTEVQLTVRARAALAGAAYDAGGAPDGYERLATVDGPDGFRAAVFRDTRTGEVVVAFAGTTPTQPSDWGQNAQNAAGLSTSQGRQAIQVARDAVSRHGGQVSFTGHSLGGGLAALAALSTGGAASTFNAAGIGDGNYAAAVRANGGRVSEELVTNYRTPEDVLSVGLAAGGLDTAAGAQVTVASNTRNPVDAHGLDGYDWPEPAAPR